MKAVNVRRVYVDLEREKKKLEIKQIFLSRGGGNERSLPCKQGVQYFY